METNFDINLFPFNQISSEKWKNANQEAKKSIKSEPDDIIHAWESGVDKGMDTTQQILKKSFLENIQKAFNVSESLYAKLGSIAKIENVYLRANDITNFETLLIVEKAAYISEKRNEIYEIARATKAESKGDFFNISFTFMPYANSINQNSLNSEGFVFKYEGQSRTS